MAIGVYQGTKQNKKKKISYHFYTLKSLVYDDVRTYVLFKGFALGLSFNYKFIFE